MRTPAVELLDEIESYYGTTYPNGRLVVMAEHVGWMPVAYRLELYKRLIYTHPTYRGLPDLAVIAGIRREMGPMDTYLGEEERRKALPDPDELPEDPKLMRHLRDRINDKIKHEGEINHEERERIRRKVKRGDATADEAFWIKVKDEYNNDWEKAHRRTQ